MCDDDLLFYHIINIKPRLRKYQLVKHRRSASNRSRIVSSQFVAPKLPKKFLLHTLRCAIRDLLFNCEMNLTLSGLVGNWRILAEQIIISTMHSTLTL
jgi:hypothetical protein